MMNICTNNLIPNSSYPFSLNISVVIHRKVRECYLAWYMRIKSSGRRMLSSGGAAIVEITEDKWRARAFLISVSQACLRRKFQHGLSQNGGGCQQTRIRLAEKEAHSQIRHNWHHSKDRQHSRACIKHHRYRKSQEWQSRADHTWSIRMGFKSELRRRLLKIPWCIRGVMMSGPPSSLATKQRFNDSSTLCSPLTTPWEWTCAVLSRRRC